MPVSRRPPSSPARCCLNLAVLSGCLYCFSVVLGLPGWYHRSAPSPELANDTSVEVAAAPSPPPPPPTNKKNEHSKSIENCCWVYTHLQKSGGSTMKNMLFDFWGPNSTTTYDSYQWKIGPKLAESVAANLASPGGLKAVAGGYPEALRSTPAFQAADGNAPCRWMTVFRHPVPRLVSAYYYCRIDPSDQLCASQAVSARDVDLATFAKHWGNFAVRQFALALVPHDEVVDYLASPPPGGGGLTQQELDETPGWYMLKLFLDSQRGSEFNAGGVSDAAMYKMLGPVQNLLGGYAAVGILEEWESTLSLFNAALGVPGMDWHEKFEQLGKANVDRRFEGEKHEALQNALVDEEINKYLRVDLLLYKHALDMFRQQKQFHGID